MPLPEEPSIEVRLAAPLVTVECSTSDRVLVQFAEVDWGGGPNQPPEAVPLWFSFDREQESGCEVEVEQPRTSGRAAAPGGYHVRVAWPLLAPLLALVGERAVTATITADAVRFVGAPQRS